MCFPSSSTCGRTFQASFEHKERKLYEVQLESYSYFLDSLHLIFIIIKRALLKGNIIKIFVHVVCSFIVTVCCRLFTSPK